MKRLLLGFLGALLLVTQVHAAALVQVNTTSAQTISNKTFDSSNIYQGGTLSGTYTGGTFTGSTIASSTFTAPSTFSSLSTGVAYFDSSKVLQALTLTNGQVPCGNTGLAPTACGITGTANQITVSLGAGTIGLSGPQNIHTGASPTFVGMNLSGLTASQYLKTDGSKNLVSDGGIIPTAVPTNGQIPVGNGSVYVPATIAASVGATVTNGAGTITIGAKLNHMGLLSFVSTTQIKFCPRNGNIIIVPGGTSIFYTIPSACTTAANTNVFVGGVAGQNLGASTTYWVYLFDNAGTLTMDFWSASTHTADTTYGMEIRTGDNTRVLIGMVRTSGANQFQAAPLTLSWANRKSLSQRTTYSADRSTTSASYVEINTEIQNGFLTWAEEDVFVGLVAAPSNGTSSNVDEAIAFDGTSAEAGFEVEGTIPGTQSQNHSLSGYKTGLSEGFHYATMLGATTAGTAIWAGSTSLGVKSKTYIHVMVRG